MGSYGTFYFKHKMDQMMSVRHESGFLGCVVQPMLDANREATSDLQGKYFDGDKQAQQGKKMYYVQRKEILRLQILKHIQEHLI